jgi:hypothetical protein
MTLTVLRDWSPEFTTLVDMAYRRMTRDPEYLLEHDGGLVGVTADYVVARLIGYDEQVERTMLLHEVLPELRLPFVPTTRTLLSEADPSLPDFRTARYVLQSGYATGEVRGEWCPGGPPRRGFGTVLCLRYKRRQ